MYLVCLIISNYTRKEGICNEQMHVHTCGCRQNILNFERQRNPFMQEDKQNWALIGQSLHVKQVQINMQVYTQMIRHF